MSGRLARGSSRIAVLVTTLAVAACCRSRSSGEASAPSASASTSASSAPSAAAPALRLQVPFAAALRGDEVRVLGVDRSAGGLSLARLSLDGAVREMRALPPDAAQDAKLEDVDLFVGDRGLALVTEGASGATRVSRAELPAGVGVAWEPVDAATCGTRSAVVSLGRGEGGLLATERPYESGAPLVAQPLGAATSSSLLCARAQAFVLREEASKRVALRVGGDHAEAVLATEVGSGEEQAISYQADGDGILVTRVGSRSGFSFRSWKATGDTPTPWSSPLRLPDDATVELVIATTDDIALVVSHPVPAGRECKNGEDSDAVAEVTLLARDTGKPRRERERLERWTCGADPGPFYGGAIGARAVVAWPRGADSACAKAGARFGGLAFAVVAAGAATRVERRDAASEAIEDAGCDGDRCAVVVLGRTDAAGCVPATSPQSGEPRVLVYP